MMWDLTNITMDIVTCFPFAPRYLWCPSQECPEATPCFLVLKVCQDEDKKCGASSRGPSFISFIVTGCHVLGQTASVLYCGLGHNALYHMRRHKQMFYPSALHKIFVCWMNVCIFPLQMRADTNRRHYQILAIKE